jgi:hypothetical protein
MQTRDKFFTGKDALRKVCKLQGAGTGAPG